MTTVGPSGQNIFSPKIRDQSLVRKFIGQGSTGYTALAITNGAAYIDPDAGSLNLKVYFDDVTVEFPATPPGTQIVNVGANLITRTEQGHYYYQIGPPNTQYRGVLTMVWTYTVNSIPFTFMDFAQILNQMPLYESLRDTEKCVVEEVSWMLGDLFDSTDGGPNLIEPFQTHYDFERIAQAQKRLVTRMNHIGFPITHWGVGPDTEEVHWHFHGLTVLGTYLEIVRHLVASYTEIPLFQGTNITFTDRRDYAQRWNTIFSQEWPEFVTYVKMGKRKLLQLGRGALLVGGGYYGSSGSGGIFVAGGYAAMTRGFRFYPAAAAINFGANVAIYRGPKS